MHLLVIESDDLEAHLLVYAARRRGHTASAVPDVEALPLRLPAVPHACVLGVAQLDEAGLDTIAEVRRRIGEAALIVTLSAPPGPSSLPALRSGADDVVIAPYFAHEVVKRAEMRAGTPEPDAEPGVVRVGDLEIDLAAYTAWKNGARLVLTKIELRLLYCLAAHRGRVTPTEKLLTFAWETDEIPAPSVLKTHMSHLRSKLRRLGGDEFTLRARQSLGYELEVRQATDVTEVADAVEAVG